MRRRRIYWICQASGWGLYVLVNLGLITMLPIAAWQGALYALLMDALGAEATHAYRAYVRRHTWLELPLRQLVPRVLVASVVLAVVVDAVLVLAGTFAFGFFTLGGRTLVTLIVTSFNWSAVMLRWSLIYFGIHYVWSYR